MVASKYFRFVWSVLIRARLNMFEIVTPEMEHYAHVFDKVSRIICWDSVNNITKSYKNIKPKTC